RLPLPCRGPKGDDVTWKPAYRVYFGKDWIGNDSVETIDEAIQEAAGVGRPNFNYLASPEHFVGSLDEYTLADDDETDASEAPDAEVGLDEDTDQALETDERGRWLAFLAWIGVSRALRLVHFHDVEDTSGWISTKGLTKPQGWAFRGLAETWTEYRSY